MTDNKIKLLIATSVFGYRGAEKLIVSLYNQLSRDTYDIRIVCLRDLAPYAQHLNKTTDIQVDIIGMRSNLDLKALVRFYRYIKEYDPDIVNFHSYRAALWGRPIARAAKVPVVLYSVHNKWGGFLHRLLNRTLAGLTDAIIPFSLSVRNYLIRKERIPARLVTEPIYAGIELDRFTRITVAEIRALRQELTIRPNQPVIGFIGNINQEKGIFHLIESVKTLSSDFRDLRCLIIGEGPGYHEAKSLLSRYQLAGIVSLLGPRDDIPALLRLLDVFVLPSLREGLPLVVIEAMAASCPVIATNIDGIPEIISDKENGLLILPSDPEGLTKAIRTLLADRALSDTLARNGLQTIRKKFSTERMVSDYNRLYQRYAAKRT